MDNKKLDKALEVTMNMSTEDFYYVAGEMRRDEGDREAREAGIERLSLVTHDGNDILIVKPSEMLGFWIINLFDAGAINIETNDISFTLAAGEVYRLFIKGEKFNYFVDLKDERQINKASKFLGVDID